MALVVEALLLILFLPRKIRIQTLVVLLLGGALFYFRLTPDNYWTRMETIKDPKSEGSAASRFVFAEVSWQMFQDHPFGVGYKNYQYVSPRYLDEIYLTEGKRSSHNSFFAVLCDMGFLGFVPWIWAVALALLKLRSVRRASDPAAPRPVEIYAMGVEIGLYGWLVTGLFGDNSGLDPAYWFLVVAVIMYRLQPRPRWK